MGGLSNHGAITVFRVSAGQTITAGISLVSNHEPITPITPRYVFPGQAITRALTAITA